MNQTPKISVIVAAYNAEKYIRRCLDSILAQTMPDFEVIVVNDGSTDGTPAILEEYASQDSRIKVLHKENGGVASARQAGMDAARGEYSIHIDSDDWIDPEMLGEMIESAETNHADMVFCDFYYIHPGNIVEYRSQQPKSLDSLLLLGQMMFDLNGSLCNKLIRRDLLQKYNIHFIRNMNMAEDQYMVLRLLAHEISVSYIPKAYYHYDHTQNDDSLCNSGIYAADRLRPLELISSYTDISPVQEDFDKAVFHLAFEYLYEPISLCPDYGHVFKKHRKAISRAKGFPLYTKVLIFLRIYGVRLPLKSAKKFWKSVQIKTKKKDLG